jgi:hypothetical protein
LLRGRRTECGVLDGMVTPSARVRTAPASSGEAGAGETALLRYAAESASRLRVAHALGVEAEMDLPFAALQPLCAPMLDRLDPAPDRSAMRSASSSG